MVGVPARKRAELMILTGNLGALDYTELEIHRRCLALYTHPFMHRRALMAAFSQSFRWVAGLVPRQPTRWAPVVKDELLGACLLLPVAEANVRWPISSRLVTTDATPTRGGATAGYISNGLAEELYRYTEHRGVLCVSRRRFSGGGRAIAAPVPGNPRLDGRGAMGGVERYPLRRS